MEDPVLRKTQNRGDYSIQCEGVVQEAWFLIQMAEIWDAKYDGYKTMSLLQFVELELNHYQSINHINAHIYFASNSTAELG